MNIKKYVCILSLFFAFCSNAMEKENPEPNIGSFIKSMIDEQNLGEPILKYLAFINVDLESPVGVYKDNIRTFVSGVLMAYAEPGRDSVSGCLERVTTYINNSGKNLISILPRKQQINGQQIKQSPVILPEPNPSITVYPVSTTNTCLSQSPNYKHLPFWFNIKTVNHTEGNHATSIKLNGVTNEFKTWYNDAVMSGKEIHLGNNNLRIVIREGALLVYSGFNTPGFYIRKKGNYWYAHNNRKAEKERKTREKVDFLSSSLQNLATEYTQLK